MALETLRDVFRHLLGDAYHAEQQIVAVLDGIELGTADRGLRDRVRAHRAETLHQIDNLERCFELLGTSPPHVESELVRGMIAERGRVLDQEPSPQALEAYHVFLIGRLTAVRRESCRQLCVLAEEVRHGDVRRLLEQNRAAHDAMADWIEEHAPVLLRSAAGRAGAPA